MNSRKCTLKHSGVSTQKAQLKHVLQHTLQYPLVEDLFNGRVMAQEEMNRHQKQPNFWVNGMLTSLSLERIYYDHEGLQAVLLARGKLERRR